jgi:hypothetical protein
MRTLTILLAVAGLAALGGCSTLAQDRGEPGGYRAQLDDEVIAYVEQKAVLNGAQVYWVNPPRKPKQP